MKRGTILRVNASWAVIIAGGIGAFVLAKNSIEKKRYDAMKSRERMKHAIAEEYTPTRRFVKEVIVIQDTANGNIETSQS